MRYRVRFTFPNGTTGVWALTYPTREAAHNAMREREADTGLAYTVEEVPEAPEPGSTFAHHVEILRERAKQLEAELADLKPILAAALGVPVGASVAPGEGGDSDRRRLEVLERYLGGDTFREISRTSKGQFAAVSMLEGHYFAAPTLAALADNLAERGAKP